MKKILVTVMMAVALVGCNSEENAQKERAMLAKIDSLTAENEKNLKAMGILEQITVVMDSIDANRNWIKVEIEQGVAQEDFVARMENINSYVKKAEKLIGDMEKTRSAYALQVKRLKTELADSYREIEVLQQALEIAKAENTTLVTKVEMQDAEISTKSMEIERMNEELNLIEEKILQLMVKANVTEAEAYYARGEAMEEAANRTKLAAKKKNQTLKEALALYEKSLEMGHSKAAAKVEELKGRIKS